MIQIDGKNAGGQILRTAVALSAITRKPVKITNIRGARPEPGLKTQHMEGVNAVGDLANAKISGLSIGSGELIFEPRGLEAKDLKIEISTAGSIGLVLQALFIVSMGLDRKIQVSFNGGGTWGAWAPPLPYLEKVFLPLIGCGDRVQFSVLRDGFYPKGGASVTVSLSPLKPKTIKITEKGKLNALDIFSVSSSNLAAKRVAERQAESARTFLKQKLGKDATVAASYSETPSTGSGILITGTCENSILGADALGAPGVSAEDVGRKAAGSFLDDYSKGAVDMHAADMVLPYIASAGKGEILSSRITNHILTSVEVIEKFLPVKFSIEGKLGEPGIVSVI